MVRLEYSQIVRRKLKKLYNELTQSYGENKHNYFFYRTKDKETILILELFHEKEDFMRNLFGIVTTLQETIDFWEE